MKIFKKLKHNIVRSVAIFPLLLLFALTARSASVQLVGTVLDLSGVPLQGRACWQLPVNAIDTSTNRALSTAPVCFPVNNGVFPAFATVVPNDVMQPLNLYYTAAFYDRTGALVMYSNYVVPTGGTFNVGLALPTTITTTNISYLNPAILSGNNIFTGTNTFNNITTFNALATFTAGLSSTTGLFSGQITSTVATGTAPLVIASTTVVPNLNASLLLGCTWAVPCAIGSTTPNSGAFTSLSSNTFQLASGTIQVAVQGTDTSLLSVGTFTGGAGVGVCKDANGGATTTGCNTSGFTRVSLGTNGSVCTTGTSAGATCTTTVTISPTQADTAYIPSCLGISASGSPFIQGVTKGTSSIVVTVKNGQASDAVASTYGELDCLAIHP